MVPEVSIDSFGNLYRNSIPFREQIRYNTIK